MTDQTHTERETGRLGGMETVSDNPSSRSVDPSHLSPSGAPASSRSIGKPRRRRLRRMDNRGSLFVSGTFAATAAVASMFYMSGVGESVVKREQMEQAADNAALASAAQKARALNTSALMNGTLAAVQGFLVALKAIESLVSCAFNIASGICAMCGCGWGGGCCSCCAACPFVGPLAAALSTVSGIIRAVEVPIQTIVATISAVFKSIDAQMGAVVQAVGQSIMGSLNSVMGNMQGFVFNLHSFAQNGFAQISQVMSGALGGFGQMLNAVPLGEVSTAFQSVMGVYGSLGNMNFGSPMAIMGSVSQLAAAGDHVLGLLNQAGGFLSSSALQALGNVGNMAGQIGSYIGQGLAPLTGAMSAVAPYLQQAMGLAGMILNFSFKDLLCTFVSDMGGSIADQVLWPIRQFCKIAGLSVSTVLSQAAGCGMLGSNDTEWCPPGLGVDPSGQGCRNGSDDLKEVAFVHSEPNDPNANSAGMIRRVFDRAGAGIDWGAAHPLAHNAYKAIGCAQVAHDPNQTVEEAAWSMRTRSGPSICPDLNGYGSIARAPQFHRMQNTFALAMP